MTTMLSPHFSLEEFTISQNAARLGLDNTPGPVQLANLHRVAGTMELVRKILGDRPVLVSSGYRSPEVNAAAKGAGDSAHMSGLAVDFTVPGFGTPIDICHALVPHMGPLGIDKLIWEFRTWVHLGLSIGPARHEAMTIDLQGTRAGFA
jgi:zinc D-Ala-D-Ala carboxypeptidase